LDGEVDGIAAGFADLQSGSGGDAGESILKAGREMGDVVIGEDAVVVGIFEDLAFGVGMGGEGSGMRVEEGAEDAGGGGFAGGGGAVEDQDGVGPVGRAAVSSQSRTFWKFWELRRRRDCSSANGSGEGAGVAGAWSGS